MKKVILLLGLILGICNLGVTAFAEESQVEVQIDTRPGGKLTKEPNRSRWMSII